MPSGIRSSLEQDIGKIGVAALPIVTKDLVIALAVRILSSTETQTFLAAHMLLVVPQVSIGCAPALPYYVVF